MAATEAAATTEDPLQMAQKRNGERETRRTKCGALPMANTMERRTGAKRGNVIEERI